jgi:hypothetical protein
MDRRRLKVYCTKAADLLLRLSITFSLLRTIILVAPPHVFYDKGDGEFMPGVTAVVLRGCTPAEPHTHCSGAPAERAIGSRRLRRATATRTFMSECRFSPPSMAARAVSFAACFANGA